MFNPAFRAMQQAYERSLLQKDGYLFVDGKILDITLHQVECDKVDWVCVVHDREDWQVAVDVGTNFRAWEIWEYAVDILNSTTQEQGKFVPCSNQAVEYLFT